MSPGAHKSKTITFHYVLHTFLYVPRQPSFLEGGFLGTFGARYFLLRSRALPCTSASSLVRYVNHARRTEVIASRSELLSLHCIWQPVSTSLRPSTRVLGKQTVCCFHYQFSSRSHTFRLRSYTFRRGFRNDLLIFHTFLYVVSNPYAVSDKCTQIIRSYTFCATLPHIRRKLYSNHTFLYVLSNPLPVFA